MRSVIVGTGALVAFGVAESRPRRQPRWLGRWVFQLLAMAVAIPFSTYAAYCMSLGGPPDFVANPKRFVGFAQLTVAGIFFGAWIALGAMIRQRDARAPSAAGGTAWREQAAMPINTTGNTNSLKFMM